MNLPKLQYPVGEYRKPTNFSMSEVEKWVQTISEFPTKLRSVVSDLTPEQLASVYRPNGWNVQQLVHHCADSHMNSFIRIKLALTEDTPTIKPYLEAKWAELPDTTSVDIEASLKILDGLHQRWDSLLKSLTREDLHRQFVHPEHGSRYDLAQTIALYAWHCDHHLAHIKIALGLL